MSNASGWVCPSKYALSQTYVPLCDRLLVGHGYDLNTNGVNGTPLHEAALYGKTKAVKFLIEVQWTVVYVMKLLYCHCMTELLLSDICIVTGLFQMKPSIVIYSTAIGWS